MSGFIKILLEHVASDILKRHKSLEMISGIHDREYISLRFSYNFHQFGKRSIYPDRSKIRLNKFTCLKESKHCLIAVMGKELTLLSDSLGIDRIWLHHPCTCIRNSRSKDQRNKQFISSCHICNKEDRCHRSLHDS